MTTGNNQFLPLAIGSGANVLTPAAYAALSTLIQNGYQSGVAQSIQVNTTLRQATFVASAIAQIIANDGVDALDDGNITGFVAKFIQAINDQGITANQFDSSAKLSTTAFVQRALGNYRDVIQYTNSTTNLSASDIGKTVICGGGSNTLNLPLASTVAKGSAYAIFSQGGTNTINVTGSDILGVGGNISSTSFQLIGSDYAIVVASGSNSWSVVSGTPMLKQSSVFSASLGASGYQRLPSGLIIQWGQYNSGIGDGSPVTITFPIAFPNGCASIGSLLQWNTPVTGSSVQGMHGYILSLSQANFFVSDAGSVGNVGFTWIAIGY